MSYHVLSLKTPNGWGFPIILVEPWPIDPSTMEKKKLPTLAPSHLHLKVLRIAGTVVSVVAPIHLLARPGGSYEAAMTTACGLESACQGMFTNQSERV